MRRAIYCSWCGRTHCLKLKRGVIRGENRSFRLWAQRLQRRGEMIPSMRTSTLILEMLGQLHRPNVPRRKLLSSKANSIQKRRSRVFSRINLLQRRWKSRKSRRQRSLHKLLQPTGMQRKEDQQQVLQCGLDLQKELHLRAVLEVDTQAKRQIRLVEW